MLSIDGDWRWVSLDAEYRENLFETGGETVNVYARLGVQATPALAFHFQVEDGNLTRPVGPGRLVKSDLSRDYGVAINYSFSPQLRLKAEYHEAEGFLIDDAPLPPDFFPRLNANVPFEYTYAIISLAASF